MSIFVVANYSLLYELVVGVFSGVPLVFRKMTCRQEVKGTKVFTTARGRSDCFMILSLKEDKDSGGS